MKKTGFLLVLATVALTHLAADALALETHPALRKSFVLGLGVGWANAGANLTTVEEVERQNGIASDVTLGWAVRNDMVLGAQFDLWSQFFGDSRWVFNLSSVALTYFPLDKGAYLTASAGFGTSRIEYQNSGQTIQQDSDGWGYSIAGGYEWRIYPEVALGPRVKWVYLDIGGDVTTNADYLSIMVELTWYKPE